MNIDSFTLKIKRFNLRRILTHRYQRVRSLIWISFFFLTTLYISDRPKALGRACEEEGRKKQNDFGINSQPLKDIKQQREPLLNSARVQCGRKGFIHKSYNSKVASTSHLSKLTLLLSRGTTVEGTVFPWKFGVIFGRNFPWPSLTTLEMDIWTTFDCSSCS